MSLVNTHRRNENHDEIFVQHTYLLNFNGPSNDSFPNSTRQYFPSTHSNAAIRGTRIPRLHAFGPVIESTYEAREPRRSNSAVPTTHPAYVRPTVVLDPLVEAAELAWCHSPLAVSFKYFAPLYINLELRSAN